jgi:hypothetical protein
MTEQPWGRVDDDGTVFVRTGEGETQVGVWKAGAPDEALAFYTRRYEGAVVEADLLSKRLASGGVDAESALATIGRLRTQIDTPAMVVDLDALKARLDALVTKVDERRAAQKVEKQAAKEKAVAEREAFVARAEALASSTQWKATGDTFRTMLDEWKALPRVDRGVEQAMWKRFSAARSTFDKARRTHFATLDVQRTEAKAVKEKLVKQAEALAESKEWGPTGGKFRDLMVEWKAAGRAGRSDDDALWARFKAAQDAFFGARDASNAERNSEETANLDLKRALADQAEALLPVTKDNVGSVKSALRDLNAKWEAIGHVPRADRPALEARLRMVDDAVRGIEEEQWRRSNPEARARAQAAVDQLETTLASLRTKAEKAAAAGNTKGVEDAEAAIAARTEWLVEARKALDEFSG